MGDSRIVREIPEVVALNDFKLLFTSGNILSIELMVFKDHQAILVETFCDQQTLCLREEQGINFISQFPLYLFAKTPELAKLHLEN